jgi:hypothetical protein
LREEGTLRMCEKRALKKISGLKRDAVRKGWITFYSEELQNC